MQIIFVWLVICSRSSSLIRIDDTLLDRTAELRIHSCGDAEHVLPSCSYLCHNAYQPLFWLVCGPFALNVGKLYHGHINKHPCRVARVCNLPLHITISELTSEYIFVSRLSQYQRYVVKSILTDATLTYTMAFLGSRWSSHYACRLLKGAFIRLLNNQSHSIDIFQIFHHASVEMFEILSYNWCLDIQMNVFYSVRAQEINNARGMHSDRHCCMLLLLTLLPDYSISSELWSAFCSLYRIAIFASFSYGM